MGVNEKIKEMIPIYLINAHNEFTDIAVKYVDGYEAYDLEFE